MRIFIANFSLKHIPESSHRMTRFLPGRSCDVDRKSYVKTLELFFDIFKGAIISIETRSKRIVKMILGRSRDVKSRKDSGFIDPL